jgi:hypothetical protein
VLLRRYDLFATASLIALGVAISNNGKPALAQENLPSWGRAVGGVREDTYGDDDDKYLRIELFRAFNQTPDELAFATIRGMIAGDERKEIEGGGGVRKALGDGSYGIGVNASFGYGMSEEGTDNVRFALGLEAFTGMFDARATGYLVADDDENKINGNIGEWQGIRGYSTDNHEFTITQDFGTAQYERGMSGVSGELGLNFQTDLTDTLTAQSRLAVGGYYFVAEDGNTPKIDSKFDLDIQEEDYDSLEGVRGSAGVKLTGISDNMSLLAGVGVSYDNQRDLDVSGGIGFEIKFGGNRAASPLTDQMYARMIDPIHRERFEYA